MSRKIVVLVLAALLLATACKKEHSGSSTDLLADAMEYNGNLPQPAIITYNDQGTVTTAEVYPGQVIVFVNPTVDHTRAGGIITSQGGTVLAQIPSVGYYLVGIDGTAQSNFIATLQANTAVDMVIPHVAGYLTAGATILDGCGVNHSTVVERNLKACGGTYEGCRDIASAGSNTYVRWDRVVHGIIEKANVSKSEPTLINISAAGGFNTPNWSALTPSERLVARASWLNFMKGLFAVYNLPAAYRQNLVITISSGNGDMPITDLMEELKQNPKLKDVLTNNVLVVSNTATGPFAGNYSQTDADVAVTDNSDASLGTSFAAPCALGIIQSIMDEQHVSAAQALQAVKLASLANANRVIKKSEAVNMLNTYKYAGSPATVTFGPYVSQSGPNFCYQEMYFDIQPSALWNGAHGALTMPTHFRRELLPESGGGCVLSGVTEDNVTINVHLMGTNQHIYGHQDLTYVKSGGTTANVPVYFTGSMNNSGNMTGVLNFSLQGKDSSKVTITLMR